VGFLGDALGWATGAKPLGMLVGNTANTISGSAGLNNEFQAKPYGMTQGQWVPGQGGGISSILGGQYQPPGVDPTVQAAFTYNDPNAPAYTQGAQSAQNQGAQAYAAQQGVQGQQGGLAALLQQAAQGQGPSIAGLQLQQGLDRSRQQAQGMAANAVSNGVSPALAWQMANNALAGNTQQATSDAAMQRVNETLAGRQQLSQLLGTMGQQNLGQQSLAGNQALNYYGMGQQGAQFGQQSQMSLQDLLANNFNVSQQINSGVAANNTATQGAVVGGLLNGAGSAIGLGLGRK
jgi:hypothetical protein